jgi:glycyl-tRNA synthetase
LPDAVFKSSGHLDNFVDPIVECLKCKTIFRADKLIEEVTKKMVPENLTAGEFDNLIQKNKIHCISCKSKLGKVRKFNMMFSFGVGPRKDEPVSLRPETCQNIFIDFPRLYKTTRIKLPIGVAQVGKSFRNEISPRQSLLRQREFSQAEIEVFFHPSRDFGKFDAVKKVKLKLQLLGTNKITEMTADDAVRKKIISHKLIAYYLALLQQFYEKIGLQRLRFRQLSNEEKAFYAKEAWDFEVSTDVGWLELVACNYRGDHDLQGHQKGSQQDLTVMDGEEKILPHVFELSMGIDRSIYAILENAYHEETVKGDNRIVLKLSPWLAPVDVAVFPLVNKDKLPKLAAEVNEELKECYDTFYDESGSIGKRYRRADEIGVPFCITIDYDSFKKKDVTVRFRDSMQQKRIKIKDLSEYLCKFY